MSEFRYSGLRPEILRAVDEMGFEELMPVQEEVIPAILENDSDLIGLAQTGTGKTASFGLPLLHKMDEGIRNPQLVILTPTRELCMQIANDFESFSKYMNNIRVVAVYGGASIEKQIGSIRRGVHAIIATPGRLLDLIRRKCIDFRNISTVVLDEADEMLNMGFREDMDTILKVLPKDKRTLMFSATMSKDIAAIAANFMHEPLEIVIGKRNVGAENVHHIYYVASAHDRYQVLRRVIDYFPDMYALIFCRTREETKKISEQLMKDGYNADALHGDLSQSQRDMAMQKFRLKNTSFLVATDVAARGLDVTDLTHVINYNLPDDPDAYTHRSGRTGRAGKEGISICIVHSREMGKIRQIEKIINKKIEKKLIPNGKEICEKQLFTFISKVENTISDFAPIEPYITAINKKLDWLSKEDIIQRMVKMEFTRLLSSYEHAPDLNLAELNRTRTNDGGERRRRRDENFTRFFLNFGEIDGLEKPQLIGMIKDATGDRYIEIGRIDIMHKFSFFECKSEDTEKVMKSFTGATKNDRRLVVDLAQPSERKETSYTERRERRDTSFSGRRERKGIAYTDKKTSEKKKSFAGKQSGKSDRQNSRERNFYGKNKRK